MKKNEFDMLDADTAVIDESEEAPVSAAPRSEIERAFDESLSTTLSKWGHICCSECEKPIAFIPPDNAIHGDLSLYCFDCAMRDATEDGR